MSGTKGYPDAPPPASYDAPPTTTTQPQGPPPATQPPQHTTVVIQQPGVAVNLNNVLGTGPTTVTCPFCSATMCTRCEYVTGTGTWVAVGVLALVGCWCGCCLIPLCVNAAKDVEHHCTNCGKHLGTTARLGGL